MCLPEILAGPSETPWGRPEKEEARDAHGGSGKDSVPASAPQRRPPPARPGLL